MQILHVIENLRGGGANRGVFALAKLSRRLYGHEHAIMAVRYTGGVPALPKGLEMAAAAGMRTVVTPAKSLYHAEFDRADVVLLHWWGSPHIRALRYRNMMPCRLGIVYHVGGDNEADMNENVITEVELRWADVNVAASRYTYDRVFCDLPPERKAYVSTFGCADFERFTHGKEPIPHEGFRVGLTCALSFNKLRRRWVQMCAEVAASVPATFAVCGNGRHARSLQIEARELGLDRVEFKGFLGGDEYGDEIRTWDVMAYPTVRDAAPVGLQDAMWFGVPPIVFAHTAPAYMVEDEVTGWHVRTEREYIEAIKCLYHYPAWRAEIGRNAREYAEEHFDPVKNAPDFEALLHRLAALPKRRHDSRKQLDKEGR